MASSPDDEDEESPSQDESSLVDEESPVQVSSLPLDDGDDESPSQDESSPVDEESPAQVESSEDSSVEGSGDGDPQHEVST